MVELGEYHKRRIIATFQQVDELLSQITHVLVRARSDSQSGHVQNVSPSKFLRFENHIELIRKHMSSFLERFQIGSPKKSLPSNWIMKTILISADVALEDIYPAKMKGYGEMDSEVARELTHTLQEIRKQVNQLLQALDQD